MTDQFYFLGASSQFHGGDQFASRESRDVVPILIRESPKLAYREIERGKQAYF